MYNRLTRAKQLHPHFISTISRVSSLKVGQQVLDCAAGLFVENLISALLAHLHNSLLWEQNDPRLAIRALPRTNPFQLPLLTTVSCFVILLRRMLPA